ncbi:hypothetical protein ACIQYC_17785 [Lysinibacillus sp. NPDC096826]
MTPAETAQMSDATDSATATVVAYGVPWNASANGTSTHSKKC